MANPFRELTAAQVEAISARNKASRTHRLVDEARQVSPKPQKARKSRPDAKSGHSKPSTTRKNNIRPNEHEEQVALMRWWDHVCAPQHRIDKMLLFAIPNGGRLKGSGKIWHWQQGTRSGVPDLFLAWPSCLWKGDTGRHTHGLFIEMKRSDGGRITKEQSAYINRLREAGYQAVICRGMAEAKRAILEYIA